MEWAGAVVPVAAVVVGWLLGEAGRGRQSRKEATGKAIAEVLLLWNDLRQIYLIQRITEKLELGKQEQSQVLRYIISTQSGHGGLSARLEAIVPSLATFDPFLACELRVKTSAALEAVDDLKRLNPLFVRHADLEDAILGLGLGKRAVEKLLFYLTWRHGVGTLFRLIKLLLWGQLPNDPEFLQRLVELAESYIQVQPTGEAHDPADQAGS